MIKAIELNKPLLILFCYIAWSDGKQNGKSWKEGSIGS